MNGGAETDIGPKAKNSFPRMSSICVIGAGVSGLTTAIELIRKGHRVTNVADATRDNTTSTAAAAFWYPFWTGVTPDHSWYRPTWAWESFITLNEFVADPATGVTEVQLLEYFDSTMKTADVSEVIESMWWRAMPRTDFEFLTRQQIPDLTCAGRRFQSGSRIRTLVVNMSCYLRRLEDVFSSLGGTIVDRHLIPSDLLRLSKEFDYVVSCCGLGARELVGDENVVPVEGIVVHVKPANDVRSITLAHTGKIFGRRPVYVVPRGGPNPDIVLGGTLGERRGGYPRHFPWPVPEEEWRIRGDAERIVRMCSEIEPGLGSPSTIVSNITSVSVGYRPRRVPSVRLEPQYGGPLAGRLIHNYGHGGGGITLSWGCAREVSKWVEWLAHS